MEDLFSLDGTVSIVTGGNSGIGKGIADGLAMKGSSIIVAGRDEAKSADAAADIKKRFGVTSTPLVLDVGVPESVEAGISKVIDQYGRVDCLVNNAGINIRKMPQEYTVDEWDKIIDVNLRGAFLCSKAVYPTMKAQGRGKIINTGSATSLLGLGKAVPYACSKMGILSLTYSLALAWARDGIFVNCIIPGWIDTPLTEQARKDFPGLSDYVESRTPMGRWGQKTDFMGIAAFLASAASDYVTGEYFRIDGGYCQHGNTVSFT